MTAITGPTCGSCKFSHPAMGADRKIDFTRRLCKRFPPHPMLMPQQQGLSMQFVWPILDTAQNCGEWQGGGILEQMLSGEHKPGAAQKADA